MKLTNQKTVITGAARGIGRALAVAFADAGAHLVVTGRDEASLVDTCAAVRARGGTVQSLAWDVADIGIAAARLAEARDRLGGLDILINNAGVLRLPAEHPQPTPEAEWDSVLTINLKAVFFICKAAGELMKAQGHSVILNIASDAGLRGAVSPYGIPSGGHWPDQGLCRPIRAARRTRQRHRSRPRGDADDGLSGWSTETGAEPAAWPVCVARRSRRRDRRARQR